METTILLIAFAAFLVATIWIAKRAGFLPALSLALLFDALFK